MSDDQPGYDDTPMLPHVEYRVHDADRPRPAAVDPNGVTTSPPPEDATVLLDDTGTDAWEHVDGGAVEWDVDSGVLEVEPGTGDIRTIEHLGDCQLHLEWAPPAHGRGDGQDRGNSGVFLMDRYEIQVLDNYRNPTYADGYAAAVYGQHPPRVNACRPPGKWQSYDIIWNGPRFDDGTVTRPATVTVLHNGVLAQHRTELLGPTGHRTVPESEPHPPAAPLRLQDHGDRVRFRNIWYRPLESTSDGGTDTATD